MKGKGKMAFADFSRDTHFDSFLRKNFKAATPDATSGSPIGANRGTYIPKT